MKKLFFIILLFTTSCTYSYKSRFSGVVLDNFSINENMNARPIWLDNQDNELGFSAYGYSIDNFKSYSKRILIAENKAKKKIIDNIKADLYDVLKDIFESNSVEKKQNFIDPIYLVDNIIENLPIDSFKRVDIYQDKQNGYVYVYGVLMYSDISKFADKIDEVVRLELRKISFNNENIESSVDTIKKFFNIFEEETI